MTEFADESISSTPIDKDKIWLTCIISITIDLISLISEFKSEYLLGYKL